MPRKVASPTQIENALGSKEKFNAKFADLIERTPGKAVLAPVDDPRPTYTVANEFSDLTLGTEDDFLD